MSDMTVAVMLVTAVLILVAGYTITLGYSEHRITAAEQLHPARFLARKLWWRDTPRVSWGLHEQPVVVRRRAHIPRGITDTI